ncbi:Bor/Iss family lipoprotein [Larkinella sp. VNQ87]|uniref:Bor/Iss family lipoprotein n=1 Tax=Larkinella sp. VNQ87 TaxID=3400921 RepID=UPI003C00A76B
MTTRVAANYDSDSVKPHRATKTAFLWGIVQPKDVPAQCESKAICKVSTKTNLGYILISAVTLGIVVPQRLIWECCPPVEREEIIR